MKIFGICRSFQFSLVLSAVLFSPAFARDLAVLNDRSAKAVALGSQFSCNSSGRIRIEAASAGFFDKRHQDLGSLFGAALHAELTRCPSLDQIQVLGMVNNSEFVRATAKASDGWILRLEPSKLDKVAASILTDIKSYRNLPKLESLFRPFRELPGVAETNGYSSFAKNAKAVIDAINANDTHFQNFAESYAKSRDQKQATDFVEQVLTTVSYYDPSKAEELRRRYKAIVEDHSGSEINDYLMANLIPGESIANIVNNVSAQVERRKPAETILAAADSEVASWIENKLLQHENEHNGSSFKDISAHLELVRSFEGIVFSNLLPETRNSVETASFWFEALSEEILAENVFYGQSLIDETGEDYYDVDLVLETSLLLAEEFESIDFADEAQLIMDHGLARIKFLIENGLPEYANAVGSEPMNFERVAFLREELAVFYELSEDYPEFRDYVEVLETGIATGQRHACEAQARLFLAKDGDSIKVDTGDQVLSLTELSCDLYTNSHLLSGLQIDATSGAAILSVDADSEGQLDFELVLASQPGTYVGVDQDWIDEIARLTIKPPSGKPDRNGATECDVLAGDPADGTLPVDGVALEELPVNYDYERAIDACIAAVEHDHNEPRQLYQLARILDFLGDTDQAHHYANTAAEVGYGPAIHLKAIIALGDIEGGENAFFDAIELFKEAAAWGYAPAMMELTELIPPGEEMFRDAPPPTDKEVLGAFGPDLCEDTGLLISCVFFEEVTKKVCFQTSANKFSCEIILRYTCDIRGKGGDPVGNFFANGLAGGGGLNRECKLNPLTGSLFVEFSKSDDGKWSYQREF